MMEQKFKEVYDLLEKTTIPLSQSRCNVVYDNPDEYRYYVECERLKKQTNGRVSKRWMWRKNLKKVRSISFGYTRKRFRKNAPLIEIKNNSKFSKVYNALIDLMKAYDPKFEFDTITLNKNLVCKKHTDRYNQSMSYILFLGDFKGCALHNDAGEVFDKPNTFYHFNGRIAHWNTPLESGTKYSMIFFQKHKLDIGKHLISKYDGSSEPELEQLIDSKNSN